jgi:hypothetical protein
MFNNILKLIEIEAQWKMSLIIEVPLLKEWKGN